MVLQHKRRSIVPRHSGSNSSISAYLTLEKHCDALLFRPRSVSPDTKPTTSVPHEMASSHITWLTWPANMNVRRFFYTVSVERHEDKNNRDFFVYTYATVKKLFSHEPNPEYLWTHIKLCKKKEFVKSKEQMNIFIKMLYISISTEKSSSGCV